MLVDVVANNVKDLLAKHQIRAADLIRMSEEAGLDVNKTFLSRLTNTKADSNQDFLLSKIDSLISVIRPLSLIFMTIIYLSLTISAPSIKA